MNDPIQANGAIIERVKGILLKPRDEWPKIAAEPSTISDLFTKYALLLAVIPPLAQLIHGVVFGYGFAGFSYRPSMIGALGTAISGYVMAIIGVAVIAFITDTLAPHFSGTSDRVSAFKLTIYAMTASWLSGVFLLVPGLGALSILGLYSIYLFYVGAPTLMKVPADKTIGFTAAVTVAAIIVMAIAQMVLLPLTSRLFVPSLPGTELTTSGAGKLTLPGGGTVDMDKMKEASDRMASATQQGGAPAVDAARLKAFLPADLGAYKLTSSESSSAGAGGINGSSASATYTADSKRIELRIADMAAVGALAGVASAFNVNSEKSDAQGFERSHSEDNAFVTEKWNNQSKFGSYTMVIANRFMVSAEGDAENFDQLKAAAQKVDRAALAALGS